MAMRCEICDKGPVVGRRVSHAHNVRPRRFEPNLQMVKGCRERRQQAHEGLHALHPLGQRSPRPALTRPRPRQQRNERVSHSRRRRKAIGPYSPALKAGNLLFLSGSIPLDPVSGQLVDGGITEQTTRVMENIKALLAAAGADFSHVVAYHGLHDRPG